jgi:hypothetical protein
VNASEPAPVPAVVPAADLRARPDALPAAEAPVVTVAPPAPPAGTPAPPASAAPPAAPALPPLPGPPGVSAPLVEDGENRDVAPPVDILLRVSSDPSGARVTVDGIGHGQTPVDIRHLPGGSHVVRITKDGYAGEQRVIRLDSTRRGASVDVTLQPQP